MAEHFIMFALTWFYYCEFARQNCTAMMLNDFIFCHLPAFIPSPFCLPFILASLPRALSLLPGRQEPDFQSIQPSFRMKIIHTPRLHLHPDLKLSAAEKNKSLVCL